MASNQNSVKRKPPVISPCNTFPISESLIRGQEGDENFEDEFSVL